MDGYRLTGLALALVACAAGTTTSSGSPATGGAGGAPSAVSSAGGYSCAAALGCSDSSERDIICLVDGSVYEVCPPDRVCSLGKCVTPCERAADHPSSVGCEFYVATPGYAKLKGGCHAVVVVNDARAPVDLTVSFDDNPLDPPTFARIPSGQGQTWSYEPLPDGTLPPGEVALLFLSQHGGAEGNPFPADPCPVEAAMTDEDNSIWETGVGRAFRIQSSLPVGVSAIFPYVGGNSAFSDAALLYPSTAWGTQYVAQTPYRDDSPDSDPSEPDHALKIIAREDDTEITIVPSVDIVGGGGVPPGPAGEPWTFELDRGAVLNIGQGYGFSGSPVQASKPVGIVTEDEYLVIPTTIPLYSEAAFEMLPPLPVMGHRYAAVRHRNRYAEVDEQPPWRIVGMMDGTKLSYSPSPPTGAPFVVDAGDVVEFVTGEPFVVESQDQDHPFSLMAYMTGCASVAPDFVEWTEPEDCRGDPEAVGVVPTSQFRREYVFFTEPTYPETHLVVVRARGEDGAFADVELACRGKLSGWQPLGNDYEYTRVDLVTGDFASVAGCSNGRQAAFSAAPFGITVWGWGSKATGGDYYDDDVPGYFTEAVSYAYPAGAGRRGEVIPK